MAHNVEAIEHVYRLPGALGDHLQVGLPHVRADEVQRRAACGAEPVEEALQRRGLAFASDPQQTLAVAVDLIDERQVALPAAARELVDADGLDVREVAVREAPVDRHAHGPIDGIPGRGERRGDLLPRQALGPPGEEPGVGVGQSVLAGGPRDGLDLDAAEAYLSSREAQQMSESELERELHRRGQELMRRLLQGHLDQRTPGRGRRSGRGGRRCRSLAAAPAGTPPGDDLRDGAGCAPGWVALVDGAETQLDLASAAVDLTVW